MNAAGLIVNPVSGAGVDANAARTRVALAQAVAARRGVPLEIAVTEYSGHARELAARFRDAQAPLVIAWGGDGTMNEVASMLVHTKIPLAIVPSGSGNGFATELGFPVDAERAIESAFEGLDRLVDVGEINGRIFVNIAGIGFDAHIARQFQALPAGRRGGLPYVTIGLRSAWRYRPSTYTIELDGETIRTPALLLACANGCQYGNNAVIAPLACVDDGHLEVVVVKPWPTAANFLRLHHLFRRTAHRAPGVITRSTKSARVTAKEPFEIHVDGEIVEPAAEARVRVVPTALTLRVSRSAGTVRGSAR